MRARIPGVKVQGVLGGKAFFHVQIDPDAWSEVFAYVKEHDIKDAVPDWWMVGQATEAIGVTNQVGQMGGRVWNVVATIDPEWWISIVKKLIDAEEKEPKKPSLVVMS